MEQEQKEQQNQEAQNEQAQQNQAQGQQIQGKIQSRIALLIFCKDVSTPIVLYFDNPVKVYEDVKKLINSKEIKMVEFEPVGPIKRAAVLSCNIMSVALQEERYLTQEK